MLPMKRFAIGVFCALAFCAFAFHALAAGPAEGTAQDLGKVTETDIVAVIDASPIESYNYRGYTYFVAEDLIDYGFDVVWDADARTLSITREPNVLSPYFDPAIVNTKKEPVTFRPLFDVLSTDIVTSVAGQVVEAYNIGGKTVIRAEDLGAVANVTYDDAARRITLTAFEPSLAGMAEQSMETGAYLHETWRGVFSGKPVSHEERYDAFFNSHAPYRDRAKKLYFDDMGLKFGEYLCQSGSDLEKIYLDAAREKLLALVPAGDAFVPTLCFAGDALYYFRQDDSYRFGFRLAEVDDLVSGCSYHYLQSSGEKYLIQNDVEFGNANHPDAFLGVLYRDGAPIFEGRIERTVDGYLQAVGYDSADGVVYYDVPYDSVYYRGEVANGMPHGTGAMYLYSEAVELPRTDSYRVLGRDGIETLAARDPALLFEGEFANGLPNGKNAKYRGGMLVESGQYESGQLAGNIVTYQQAAGNDYEMALASEGTMRRAQDSNSVLFEGKTYRDVGTGRLLLAFDGVMENGIEIRGKRYAVTTVNGVPQAYLSMEGELDDRLWTVTQRTVYQPDGKVAYRGAYRNQIPYDESNRQEPWFEYVPMGEDESDNVFGAFSVELVKGADGVFVLEHAQGSLPLSSGLGYGNASVSFSIYQNMDIQAEAADWMELLNSAITYRYDIPVPAADWPAAREAAQKVFSVKINGQTVEGQFVRSQGNGHVDYTFLFDQEIDRSAIETISICLGKPAQE